MQYYTHNTIPSVYYTVTCTADEVLEFENLPSISVSRFRKTASSSSNWTCYLKSASTSNFSAKFCSPQILFFTNFVLHKFRSVNAL